MHANVCIISGAAAVKYAPIIVLAILALGIVAVTIYRPHGAVRGNTIGANAASAIASTCSSMAGYTFIVPTREVT